MNVLEKLYSFLILFSVVLGIGLGHIEFIETNVEGLIMPLLVVMLYLTFLQIPMQGLTEAFRNKRFTLTSVAINFIWTPIFAWVLASLLLADHPALYLGFIMLMVTPCTDWYLIFTGLAKGNVSLSTAILPLNLVLQIILLPVYLYIFGDTTGAIELSFLIESILLVLLIPFLLAVLTNTLFRKRIHLKDKLLSTVSSFPILLLSLAIVAMFASQGSLLLKNLDLLWQLAFPILLFFSINLIIGQRVGKRMTFSYADRASLSLTTLARNSPIALAIAMTAFPEQPLIALTLIVGPLLELPILAIITHLLLSSRNH